MKNSNDWVKTVTLGFLIEHELYSVPKLKKRNLIYTKTFVSVFISFAVLIYYDIMVQISLKGTKSSIFLWQGSCYNTKFISRHPTSFEVLYHIEIFVLMVLLNLSPIKFLFRESCSKLLLILANLFVWYCLQNNV
jgi:hypothetical protein